VCSTMKLHSPVTRRHPLTSKEAANAQTFRILQPQKFFRGRRSANPLFQQNNVRGPIISASRKSYASRTRSFSPIALASALNSAAISPKCSPIQCPNVHPSANGWVRRQGQRAHPATWPLSARKLPRLPLCANSPAPARQAASSPSLAPPSSPSRNFPGPAPPHILRTVQFAETVPAVLITNQSRVAM